MARARPGRGCPRCCRPRARSIRWCSSTTTEAFTAAWSTASRYIRRTSCRPSSGTDNIDRVLLALPSLTRRRRREILSALEPLGVHVQTVPEFEQLVTGKANVEDIREVDVCDLLGRDSVPPKAGLFEACIRDQVVMVTGAGGSIGSELCRQIIGLGPKRLVLFEMSELALYNIERELRTVAEQNSLQVELVGLIGNGHHKQRMREILSGVSRPDRVSRRRLQARADRRAERHRRHLQQRDRDLVHGGGRARDRGRNLRAGIDRQGGQSHQCHGRDQALRGDGAAGAAPARHQDAILHGALRQRAGLIRLGRAAVQRADQGRRPGDGDASGGDPLFHDHSRGGAAGHPGRIHGRWRRGVRARHGQARAHLRSGEAHDPPDGPDGARRAASGRRHRDRLHGPAARPRSSTRSC